MQLLFGIFHVILYRYFNSCFHSLKMLLWHLRVYLFPYSEIERDSLGIANIELTIFLSSLPCILFVPIVPIK
jgi:hypothetical protein